MIMTKKSLLNTLNRLNETAIWIYCVMHNIDTLKPNGNGWKAIVRVRLFHSRIRYQLNKEREPGNDNPASKCAVINQLHLIATLLGFVYNPLSVCKNLLMIPVSDEEKANYLLLWKYIGYVLGIKYDIDEGIDPVKDYETSRAWMVKIFDYIINPDCKLEKSTTKMLSYHVLNSIAFGTDLMLSWRKYVPWFKTMDMKQYIENVFSTMGSNEYMELLNFKPASFKFELMLRINVAFIRTFHVILNVFKLEWLNIWLGNRSFTRYANILTYDMMEKKGNYKCRFAKYMM